MIPWKVFWTVTGVILTAIASATPVLFGVAPYWTISAAVLVALLIMRLVGDFVHTCDLFWTRTDEQRASITRWIRASVLLHLAWLVALQILPSSWAALIAVLAGLGSAEYLFAELYEYRAARKGRCATAVQVGPDGQPLDLIGQNFMYAMESVGRGRVELVEYEHITEEGNG